MSIYTQRLKTIEQTINNLKHNKMNRELNRDIKRLVKYIEINKNSDNYFTFLENDAKKEFLRIYNASGDFNGMNKKNILIMLRLNLRYRFLALHTFGLHLDLDLIKNY